MFDPDTAAASFEDELLEMTLCAVRRKRQTRRALRFGAVACCVTLAGIFALRHTQGVSEPARPVVEAGKVEAASPEPVLEIVNTDPVDERFIVRTDRSLVDKYVVRTPEDSRASIARATDTELLAALEGKRVLLTTSRDGRSVLKFFD